MNQIYNIYCDESCHLENDGHLTMVLGAIWCPLNQIHHISQEIRKIKKEYHLSPDFEIKWIKVSPAKVEFYERIIDYFFNNDDLHFRGLIVGDKSKLNHKQYSQDHDDWYYKMYFILLKTILDPNINYRIYLDIKDTKSQDKVDRLHQILSHNLLDFSRSIIERIQNVRSHEIEILQITDLLIGAIAYENRGLNTSLAKKTLVEKIKKLSKYNLTKSTLYRENKLNLFRWDATETNND
jgi:hypothetical protein